MFAGEAGSEALLVGGFSRCFDMVGAVGSPLDDGFAAIESAVVPAGKIAFEPFDGDDVFYFHKT